jgi:hypothetical protein
MVKAIVAGKKHNFTNSEEDLIKILENLGAKRQDVKTKSIDPFTVGLILTGVGGYIYYSLTKDKMAEFKSMIKQS